MNLKPVNKKKASIHNRYTCVCCISAKMFKSETTTGTTYERLLHIEHSGSF